MSMNLESIDIQQLKGKSRRLYNEWKAMHTELACRSDIRFEVIRCNADGLPVSYHVVYHIHSICGIAGEPQWPCEGKLFPPCFADEFHLMIEIPRGYPDIDAVPSYRFMLSDENRNPIPHPWHPNIRYDGSFAGRVCLNQPDTYAGIAWAVKRIGQYLRYERFHAEQTPPYPEDLRVARWVREQGIPQGWIYF